MNLRALTDQRLTGSGLTGHRRWLRTAVVVALVLHLVLPPLLAGSDSASVLLSPGEHTGPADVVPIVSVLVCRWLAILVVPGAVVYELAMIAMTWRDGAAAEPGAE